ncbi:E3 ubiquitin-protein ligase SIAH1A-like [Suncus etruscus]|uniref:E3 ubiquitin-protein ligase SIAH1A-like n=1 Tax=Suncus etruscus TaxID=109475 RepID=UPI00210F71F3|nr:E3 ubiquitin-protein ligase SIAH1A-like [Suncus etruscus]
MSQPSSSASNGTNQSVPTQLDTAELNRELVSIFECPVCYEYVLPPIYQCHRGHLVCIHCRPKLTCCPSCRGSLRSIRNLAMEKVANAVFFPCKNASTGCVLCLPYPEKLKHEDICKFRCFPCPCPGTSCKWQGLMDLIVPHLTQDHESIITLQGEDIIFLATDTNLPGNIDWIMVQSCFGFHFILILQKREIYHGHQQFFAIVQMIASINDAEKFLYRLDLSCPKRRLTWEATPKSIYEGVTEAILSGDCFVFDTTISDIFSDSGNLAINVTISKRNS